MDHPWFKCSGKLDVPAPLQGWSVDSNTNTECWIVLVERHPMSALTTLREPRSEKQPRNLRMAEYVHKLAVDW